MTEQEKSTIRKGDELELTIDSLAYGVPAKIGPYGVERIYELDVSHIREDMERSAAIVKEDIVSSGSDSSHSDRCQLTAEDHAFVCDRIRSNGA